jgi:transposase
MLKNKTPMSKIRQALRLYTQGKSKMFIKEHTGLSRNTVKKYINLFIESKQSFGEVNKLTDRDLDELFGNSPKIEPPEKLKQLIECFPAISKELKRKGVTLEIVWNGYYQTHEEGYRFTQFCKHYNNWKRQVNPVMHIEHKVGDKMFVDYAGDKQAVVDTETGEVRDVEVFVAILGASQLTYVEATESQKKEDFIATCENAMHYFGGVPLAIVPDNLKSAVTKSDRYEPTLNETFADFAEHYGTTIIPARAYRPKDKSLVEGMVKIIYTRIYAAIRKEKFFSLAQLNEAIRAALEDLNNGLLKGRDYSRRQQFEELERPVLQSLPSLRYEFKKQQVATVLKDGHVCLGVDKHYYSVPYKHIGKKVKIIYTKERVEIFLDYSLIADHDRMKGKYSYTTISEHMASKHRYVAEWSPAKFISWAEKIGTDAKLLIEQILMKKQHPEQSYKSCIGVLKLAPKAGNDRMNNACKRALEYGIYNYKIVQTILEKNLDKSSPDNPDNDDLPPHDNIRGEEYFV